MDTYQRRTREELELDEHDWQALRSFVEENVSAFRTARDTHGIDEPPPSIQHRGSSETFSPGGWVGYYPGGIEVTPGKLTAEEYRSLVSEVAGWLEIWSVPTAAAALPLVSDRLLEPESVLLAYSSALIEFTESMLAHRPHVAVERETGRGFDVRGRVDVAGTIRQRGRGSRQVVTERPQFTFETLPNQLLVRFHAELASELRNLLTERIAPTDELERHVAYHREFVEDGLPADLLETSLDVAFTDPDVLRRTRASVSGSLAEVVDLWEAYLGETAMNVDFEDQLNVGVKPISTLYELWVLRALIEVVESETGTDVERVSDDLSAFAFGHSVRLYHDTSLPRHSALLDDLVSSPGRPDFALVVDGDVRWVGDAKFKTRSTVGLSDYRQLLSYGADLLPADGSGAVAVIHVDDARSTPTRSAAGFDVAHVGFRPRVASDQRPNLGDCLTEALGERAQSGE